ncbi:MAG: DUF1553 domain-containing protein [Planctomycetaceae bacterium]
MPVQRVNRKYDPARGGRSKPGLTYYDFGAVNQYLTIKGDGAPPKAIANCRSVYFPVYRAPRAWAEGLRLMGAPLPVAVTGARPTTTVPTQALFLLNSDFLIEQSRHAAKRLLASKADDADAIRQFYLAALNRPATDAEVESALAFIADEESQLASHEDAWAQFCHAVFVSNEFLFRL